MLTFYENHLKMRLPNSIINCIKFLGGHEILFWPFRYVVSDNEDYWTPDMGNGAYEALEPKAS
jgi:hypothetical protein